MQKKVKTVVKPILYGSWHGKDARKKGYKIILSVLYISLMYTILGLLLSVESLMMRIITGTVFVTVAFVFMYFKGAAEGEADVSFAEIMYNHQQDGKDVVQTDKDRCFHPAKGFYEIAIGLIPYFLITIPFSVIAEPVLYSLGVLPSWIEGISSHTNIGQELAYYSVAETDLVITILRVMVRAMTMPFVNIALKFGTNAVLLVERLAPLLISIAPLGYGFGYMQGRKYRNRINTGIQIGIHKKKKKERRDRRERVKSKTPERLI